MLTVPLQLAAVSDAGPSALPAYGFAAVAALLVLFSAASGYRMGLWRKGAGLVSLLIAYVAGWFLAPAGGALLASFLDYPELLLQIAGGALVGLTLYITLGIGARFFLPGPEDTDSLTKLNLLTFGGLGVGAVTGFLYVFLLLMGIHVLGTVSEARLEIDAIGQQQVRVFEVDDAVTILPAPQETLAPYDGALPEETRKQLEFFAGLRSSLRTSWLGSAVDLADPIPEKAHRVLDKLKLVITDEEAIRRFKQHPASDKLLGHPDVQALADDQEIRALARERKIHSLLKHPKLLAVADNEELQQEVASMDLEAVLDEILKEKEA